MVEGTTSQLYAGSPVSSDLDMNGKPPGTTQDGQGPIPTATSLHDPAAEADIITVRVADPLVGAGETTAKTAEVCQMNDRTQHMHTAKAGGEALLLIIRVNTAKTL